MRKIMNLSDDTTIVQLEWYASIFKKPIAVKLKERFELWIED